MSYPILAPNSSWFTQGNPKDANGKAITRASIKKIEIVDKFSDYNLNGATIVDQWDASSYNTGKDSGAVTAYVLSDNTLVIAGNGSGKVMANKDSSWVFSDSAKKDYFSTLTTINGGDKLDTSNADTFERMFQSASALTSVDVSNWDTSKVTTLKCMFQNATSIGNLNVSGWNTGEVTDLTGMFNMSGSNKNTNLTSLDVKDWDTSKVTNMSFMFVNCLGLESLDLSKWVVNNVTDMNHMFLNCTSLTEIDASNWDVSNVTTMQGMFAGEARFGDMSLTTIGDTSNWNVGKVTTMEAMFQRCSALESLNTTNWNTAACTDMRYMFNGCSAIQTLDVSNWDVSKVTTMLAMFRGCTSLEVLDVSNWDVSKVTTMQAMFEMSNLGSVKSQLTELDVSNWNTSSCTDMSFMFYSLNGLTKPLGVSSWDVSKVTTFDHMTAHSYATLVGVENWAPSSVCTNMNAMFHSIQNTSIDVSKFNTSKVQFFSQMFQNANKLTEIKGLENFNTANGLGFEEMFQVCSSLKELDLSSFDTRKAKDGVLGSANGTHYTATMQNMFQNNYKLEKITLGPNFTFKGDGTTTNTSHYAVLPTTVDGNWYTRFRKPVATIPDYANETYYASLSIVDNIEYFIKNGTMLDLADKIRILSAKNDSMNPIQMTEVLAGILDAKEVLF